jgi:hypothetical protein
MGNIISSIARGINAVLMAIVNVSAPSIRVPEYSVCVVLTWHLFAHLVGHHDDRIRHRQRPPGHLVLLRQAHHLWKVPRNQEECELGKE